MKRTAVDQEGRPHRQVAPQPSEKDATGEQLLGDPREQQRPDHDQEPVEAVSLLNPSE
jgi:hypothetical protein